MTVEVEGRMSPWSSKAIEDYQWWCDKRWSESGASAIRGLMAGDVGTCRFLQESCRLAREMAEGFRRTTREQWAMVPAEDVVRLSLHGLAVSKGIRTCVPATIVSDHDSRARLLRRFFYWLLVHLRASLAAVEDPYACVEGAILYDLVGPVASREFARRTLGHIGAAAGVVQFLQRTGATAASANAGRTIERELERLRKSVLGTVLRGPGGHVIGRVDRVLRNGDANARPEDVEVPLWETITDAAAGQHPLEALVRSINGEWNMVPKRAGYAAVNLAAQETKKHVKQSAGDIFDARRDGPEFRDPVSRREAEDLRQHARRQRRQPDEILVLRERLEQRLEEALTAANAISPRFGKVVGKALAAVQGLVDFRAELVRAVADSAEVSKPQARAWFRQLEEDLKLDES